MKNVAVFFGGKSVEHEISCITGAITLNSLRKGNYNPIPIYVDYDNSWWTGESLFDIETHANLNFKRLKRVCLISGSNVLFTVKGKKLKESCSISVAVNCMHGENGEDGSLCGLLTLCGIPLANADILGSSVAIDKSASKIFFNGLNVKSLPCITLTSSIDLSKAESLGFPLIVKPKNGGSSIGVSKAHDVKQLERAVNEGLRFCEKVVVEKCLENFVEINVGVYRNSKNQIITSPCEKPCSANEFLTFEDKYSNGKREFPAKIPKNIADKIKNYAERCYEGLSLEGIVRMDFMVKEQSVYINEINTVPGSLAYYLFCKTTSSFCVLLEDIISRAEKRFAVKESLQRKFASSVLQLKGVKSAKRL